MRFEHPEFLYALFSILVPLIVHFFSFKRFRIEKFTNVAFLKNIKKENRKRSKLKKILILFTRLFALTSIIFAFSKPYLINSNKQNTQNDIIIYLDNSLSMSILEDNESIFSASKKEILETKFPTNKITLLTNNKSFINIKNEELKSIINNIDYSQNQLSVEAVLNKSELLFSKSKKTKKYLLFISDFQKNNDKVKIRNNSDYELITISKKPSKAINAFIDKIELKNKLDNYELQICAKSNYDKEIQLSLYDDKILIGKSSLKKSDDYVTNFILPKTKKIKGRIVIEDNGLSFDNEFFFNTPSLNKISVLTIGGNNSANQFKRIFIENKFSYDFKNYKKINYDIIYKQNLIIISEIKKLPKDLIMHLKSFIDLNGTIIFIPNQDGDISNYNNLLKFNNISLKKIHPTEKKITSINFDHPIYRESFSKIVENFKYPKTLRNFDIKHNGNKLLSYENNKPFLIEKGRFFLFTAQISNENSNFSDSPLIVPTVYGIGANCVNTPKAFYYLQADNKLEIDLNADNGSKVKLSQENFDYTPIQETKKNKIKIILDDKLVKAGHYLLINKSDTLETLSLNYNRNESVLIYNDLKQITASNTFYNIKNSLKNLKIDGKLNKIWKWFVTFAIVFLAIEMLLLKYFE